MAAYKYHMDQILKYINQFVQKCKVKSELILEPMQHGNRLNIKLNREQKEWLLDPRTINCFRESNWTMEERCEAFRNRFPEAPRLAISTMRHFYEHNGINKNLLFKTFNQNIKIEIPQMIDTKNEFKKEEKLNIINVQYEFPGIKPT